MPPRKKVKEEARWEVENTRLGDEEGESGFAQLAQTHWLKASKKSTKVKVKQDVLKNEIWDVLEKENFEFRSLQALENLQILEKYNRLLWLFGALLTAVDTYGQVTPKIRPISTSC
jgi:intron-binding protein aquarius